MCTSCSSTLMISEWAHWQTVIIPWNNGKVVPRLVLTSLTTPGQQIRVIGCRVTVPLSHWSAVPTPLFIYISQLLRDSFSVSQQPPIWEPPSHYSMLRHLITPWWGASIPWQHWEPVQVTLMGIFLLWSDTRLIMGGMFPECALTTSSSISRWWWWWSWEQPHIYPYLSYDEWVVKAEFKWLVTFST